MNQFIHAANVKDAGYSRWAVVLLAVLAGMLASPVMAAVPDSVMQSLNQVLERRQEIYNSDPNASPQVFDELWVSTDEMVLMSEEFYRIFFGREEVQPYFNPPEANLYAFRQQYSQLEAAELAPGLVTATYHVRYEMHPVGKLAMGGWSRMLTVFKETDDGWKIQAEVQLPMSMISQSRRLHQMAVSEGFQDFARSQNPDYDEQVAADPGIRRRTQGVVPWQIGGTSQPTAEGESGD